MFFKKIASAIVLTSVVIAPTALAENLFAQTSIPSPTGKIETFYFNIDFSDMVKLIRQDHNEGRTLGSKDKPSLLTPFFARAENVGVSTTNQFAANEFSSNAQLCLTSIIINVPKSTTIGGISSSSSSRNCATGIPPYARSGIQTIYQSFGLNYYYENTKYKIGVVRDNTTTVPLNEIWGLSIFDQAGAGGRIQEMVLVQTNYF